MSLQTDVYSLMQPIIGGVVIWADQNSPRPPLPYSVIKINSVRYVNQDHYGDPDNAGIQTVKGDREFTLNVQMFGESDVVSSLSGVVDRLRLTSNIDKFMSKKLTAFNTEAVTDISALLDSTVIEKRASVDIFMRYKSSLTDNVGIIETASIEGDDDSSAPKYTITVVDN